MKITSMTKRIKRVKKYVKKYTRGITMIETLVVLVIVGILGTVGMLTLNVSRVSARDAERKADLEKIKVAFEDYYSDNNCYPPAGSLDTCDSSALAPYLSAVPCDPQHDTPYVYYPLSNTCAGYRLYASLERTDDESIAALGCDGATGCGCGNGYNYGVSAGTTVVTDSCDYVWPSGTPAASPSPSPASPSPSPSSSPNPPPSGPPQYEYACSPGGYCNQYDLNTSQCEYTWSSPDECEDQCELYTEIYACN